LGEVQWQRRRDIPSDHSFFDFDEVEFMDRNSWTFTAIVASALILAGKVTIAQSAAGEDLIALAHEKFKQFSSDAESQAFETFFQKTQDGTQDGKSVDLKEQAIKAEWLRWLCNDPKASAKVSPRGINIAHAKIIGNLDLSWAKMQFPLQTCSCTFTQSIILDWASLGGLKLEKANILGLDDKAFSGVGLTVDGDVDFSDFNAQKPVLLRNAKIGGHFNAPRAHFEYGLVNSKVAPALDLSKAKIGWDVDLDSAMCRGDVWLAGAEIGGNLDFRHARIQSNGLENEKVVDAASARIDGSVFLGACLDGDGTLSFFAANIGRDFVLDCPAPMKGATVDLRDATARTLLNARQSRPKNGKLWLRGFTFNELHSQVLNAQCQIEWLRLQPPRQPHEREYLFIA
jgi:hypothetical protein